MNTRRQFLQKLTASAAILPLLSQETFAAPYNNKPADGPVLRVAIMGLGGYATRVAEAMKDCKRAKLAGVISGTPSKIKNWQDKYNIPEKNCYNYETYHNIKDNYSVNGARYMVGEEPAWITAQETKTDFEKFKAGVDETIQFQMGFPSGATASCLSTYNMNNLDRFFLNGENGFAELLPATGYGPIKGKTNKGELTQPHVTHQTVQMDEMAAIILDGKQPLVPVDGEEGLKDMKILDAIYRAAKTGEKIELKK